jgi:diguanylate cyclase (GGDEF)-like protein
MPADRHNAGVGLGRFGQALLDAMPGRVALIDPHGTIVGANRRWVDVVIPPEDAPLKMVVGDNLPAHFRSAAPLPAPTRALALAVADAVDLVLAGGSDGWELELPLGPEGSRWDRIRVDPLGDPTGGALLSVDDVTAELTAEQARIHDATHDQVTGLPNRILLLDRLHQALHRPGRTFVAVLHLDLDRFKLVNASLGPSAGDKVLALVGLRFQSCLTDGESVARTGDDSFVVVTEAAANEQDALAVAHRLLATLTEPLVFDGHEVLVTASVGIAVAGPRFARAEDLLRDADVATTEAKEEGGGRVALSHHLMRSASVQRLEIEQALRRAVERRELWLEYQPEVSLVTGRVVGAEALLRWDHPTLGPLGPADFIGVAEKTGLIVPIGEWVLGEACAQAASWSLPDDEESVDLYVAVNVSARQLADAGFVGHVHDTLAETGLVPQRLCIEVTEGTVVQGWEVARTTLRKLRLMGARVALDDFGTGYSSLSYLLRLPVDIVKLDASFVARLASNAQDRAVVGSVVTLARRLGMQVVAEGVEDERQREVLARLGCHIVQGFGLGRPGDAQALLGAVWQRAADAG